MINEQSRYEKSAEYSWKWNSLTLISKIKYHFHFDKTVLGVFQEYWCTKSSLEPLNWMNNHCPLSGLELFRVELVVLTWFIGCGNTTSYPCQIILRSFHVVTVTFTLSLPALQLYSCSLSFPDVLRLSLIHSTGNLCGLRSTDTNASGTDMQSSRNTSNIDCTVSRRDHCNQAIRWTLCDATCLSYGREDEFQPFLYLSSLAIHHMLTSGCWPLRQEL